MSVLCMVTRWIIHCLLMRKHLGSLEWRSEVGLTSLLLLWSCSPVTHSHHIPSGQLLGTGHPHACCGSDTLVLILSLPWVPNPCPPDPTDLIEEQCRKISVRWRESPESKICLHVLRGEGGFTRISITPRTGVRFPKQPNEMSWKRDRKAFSPADTHTFFPKE